MRGWHWVLAEPRAGLCSRAGFGRDVVIHVPPSPCHHSLHGAQHCQACLHCPKLLWHPGVLPFAWAVRSSLWHGLTGLLAFPISDFYDINYSSVTAQLICIIKRCGGDWFYNNSSDLWSTFHPKGSLLALYPCGEELLLLPSLSHKSSSCSWAMAALYPLRTHENASYVQLKSKRRVRQEGLRQ